MKTYIQIEMLEIEKLAKITMRRHAAVGLELADFIGEGFLAAMTCDKKRHPMNAASEAMKKLARNSTSPVNLSDYAYRSNKNIRVTSRVFDYLPSPRHPMDEPAAAFGNALPDALKTCNA